MSESEIPTNAEQGPDDDRGSQGPQKAAQTAHAGDRPGDRPVRRFRALGPDDPAPVWTPDLWSAQRLMAATFTPPRWAVPGVICEGLSLLAGPPKVGKSWLSFGLALHVASGGRAFGKIPVRPGPVLYLALEDTPRRLQARLGKLLNGDPAPSGLDVATDWPLMTAGGDLALAAWLEAHPAARLVVVDVFAKVRGPVPMGMSAYDADYAAVGRIKRVADHYGIAVVLVHHVRKAGSEDFLEAVSGTNGIAGAADATLVLRRPRGQAEGVLHVTGRDVEEAELALARDNDTGHWLALDGPADQHALAATRAAILGYVRAAGPVGPKAIAEAVALPYEAVKKTCQRMAQTGQLHPYPGGQYTAPEPGDTPPLPDLGDTPA